MTISEKVAEVTELPPHKPSSNDPSSEHDYSLRIYEESKKCSSDEYEVLDDDSPEVSDTIIHHTYTEHMVVDKQKFFSNSDSGQENGDKIQQVDAEYLDIDELKYYSTDDNSHRNVVEVHHVYAEDLEKAKYCSVTDRSEDDDERIHHTYAEDLDLERPKYYSINENRETARTCNEENDYLQIED
ncbi:hypothetical protein HOLleu_35847 [Holothuria leucospilota]|uniref:Uncharacterized protein n=1 Tax=Holothuria leucospilota TaxID=206669 RepID=A0A9Q0YJ44_HOLLE|nr:hypothetical protein HOLleu_35847 [Holothuria leucospilota]